jgi:hypothetical protein
VLAPVEYCQGVNVTHFKLRRDQVKNFLRTLLGFPFNR